MLKEVRFAFRHDDCWLQEATERHPGVTLVISSIYMVEGDVHIDLTVHAPDRATVDELREAWEADDRIHRITEIYAGPRGTRFHVGYTSEHSIYPHLIHHTPIAMGAVRMAAGTEHYSIVGEAEDVEGLVRTLSDEGEVEVESVRELRDVPEAGSGGAAGDLAGDREGPLAEALDGLTDKQVDALLLAHGEGYYKWPRKRSASDLADELGLSVSAFLDHLRQAEGKVLDAVVSDLAARDPARVSAVRGRARQRREDGPDG